MFKKVVVRLLYRPVMRVAHHFNWHYAPPIYPEGDTQLWCQWCGFRETILRHNHAPDALRRFLDEAERSKKVAVREGQ